MSRSVAISQANVETLSHTYRNTHTTLTRTGSFTVTNTGQSNGSLSVSVSGTEAFLSKIPIHIWPATSTGACTADTTVPENATSGSWGSTTVASGTVLNAGASIVYCVRTRIIPHSDREGIATSSGSQSARPRLSATLSAAGWSTSATVAVMNTQRTEAIYPEARDYLPADKSHWYTIRSGSNENICLDAPRGNRRAPVVSRECGDGANQRWQFQEYLKKGYRPGRVTLRPRHTPDLYIYQGWGRAELDWKADWSSYWQVQQVSRNRFLLVAEASGTCLSVRPSPSDKDTTVECTDPTAVLELRREGLSYESDGWTEWFDANKEIRHATGTIFFGAKIGRKISLQYQADGKWVSTGISAEDDSEKVKVSLEVVPLSVLRRGQIPMRFVFPDGSTAYSLTMKVEEDNSRGNPMNDWWREKLTVETGLN